jgi:hypothetical protein
MAIRDVGPARKAQSDALKHLVLEELSRTPNRSQAADNLRISRRHLYRIIDQLAAEGVAIPNPRSH